MRKHKKPDRCKTWPRCVCAQHWRQWQDRVPAPEEYEAARTIIEATLSCVSHRCPIAAFREHATIQLLNPIFTERKEQDA